MAQRRALFDLPFSLPRAVPLLLLALFIVLMCAPFFSSYLRNTFAPSDRYPLIGDWVGMVTISPGSVAANPLAGSGNRVMRVTVRPVLFSYLSRLTGAGSLTDAHGQTTGFQLRPFRQPYLRDQVAIHADTVGPPDGSMTGSWNRVELAGNTLTIYNATAGNHQTVTGVLERGDALPYRKLAQQLVSLHENGE